MALSPFGRTPTIVRLAVDDQRAADRAPIRAEAAAPEGVADDDHPRIALGGGFDGGETAAEGHRHAEDVEKVGRDEHRHQRVGAIAWRMLTDPSTW